MVENIASNSLPWFWENPNVHVPNPVHSDQGKDMFPFWREDLDAVEILWYENSLNREVNHSFYWLFHFWYSINAIWPKLKQIFHSFNQAENYFIKSFWWKLRATWVGEMSPFLLNNELVHRKLSNVPQMNWKWTQVILAPFLGKIEGHFWANIEAQRFGVQCTSFETDWSIIHLYKAFSAYVWDMTFAHS